MVSTEEWVKAAAERSTVKTKRGRKLQVTLYMNDDGFGYVQVKGMNPRPFGNSKSHAMDIVSALFDELDPDGAEVTP